MKTKGARTPSGDFSASDLARLNDIVELSGDLLRSYSNYALGKRCVVFAVNVEHSQAIAERYNAAGIPACHLDGTTPDDQRREALERFRRGELLVLTNCQLFDEGLDIPALEAVQIAKPTKSLTRWLQMVGRSLRIAQGKPHAIILDHTKNWAIHGLPNRPRVWTLDGVEEQPPPRLERNPQTGEVKKVEIVEEAGSLSEIQVAYDTQWQQTFEELLLLQQQRGYKIGWVYHRLLELNPPLEIWQQYARLRGYKPGWAVFRWQEQQQAIADSRIAQMP